MASPAAAPILTLDVPLVNDIKCPLYVMLLLKDAEPASDISSCRACIAEPASFPLNKISPSEIGFSNLALSPLLSAIRNVVPSTLKFMSVPDASKFISPPQSSVIVDAATTSPPRVKFPPTEASSVTIRSSSTVKSTAAI